MSYPYYVTHTIKVSHLKSIRKAKGFTQAELSAKSGIPVKCIGNYEQRRRDINHAQTIILYRIALALDCTIEDLLEL